MNGIVKNIFIFTLLVVTTATYAMQEQDSGFMLLDGDWEIIFDHQNRGKEGLWHIDTVFEKHKSKQKIEVPSCWEEVEKDYEGVAFYRHKFIIPASWKEKTIVLNFEAVNYLSEVWLNDRVVGFHEGVFTPFSFRVDKLVMPGEENTLTVRVVGPVLLTDNNIDGMGRMEVPQWRGAITGGIWQPVSLSAFGETLVKDLFIEPDIDHSSVLVHFDLENNAAGDIPADMELKILSATGETVHKKTKAQYWIRDSTGNHGH